MASAAAAALSMKLLVDRKAQRVLFAEAGKDVADFLFSLLALPVATAVKLEGKGAMVGCGGNLYASVERLDSAYVQPGAAKDALLCPSVASPAAATGISALLRLPPPPPSSSKSSGQPEAFYRCSTTYNSDCPAYVTDAYGRACPTCGYQMTAAPHFLPSSSAGLGAVQHAAAAAAQGGASSAGGFVQGIVTYTVMDDLTVAPMSAISSITLLNTFAVRDLGDLQEKTVQLGYNEGLEILKASLQSKTVLTDLFLGKKKAPGRA